MLLEKEREPQVAPPTPTRLVVPEITEQSGIIAFSDIGCDKSDFVCGVERLSGPFIASQEDYREKKRRYIGYHI